MPWTKTLDVTAAYNSPRRLTAAEPIRPITRPAAVGVDAVADCGAGDGFSRPRHLVALSRAGTRAPPSHSIQEKKHERHTQLRLNRLNFKIVIADFATARDQRPSKS